MSPASFIGSHLHFGKDGQPAQVPQAHPLGRVVELSRVRVSLTTFKTSTRNAISYQCVKLARHQISHHGSRRSDNDRERGGRGPLPAQQVLTSNTAVSGQMQASVSLCSNRNALQLHNVRQSYYPLCISIRSVPCKLARWTSCDKGPRILNSELKYWTY